MGHEDASFDQHHNFMFSEIMTRRRTVQFIRKDIEDIASASLFSHLPKSHLFKPEISVSLPLDLLGMPNHFWSDMYRKTKEMGVPVRIPIHVVSDGRRAFVTLLNENL